MMRRTAVFSGGLMSFADIGFPLPAFSMKQSSVALRAMEDMASKPLVKACILPDGLFRPPSFLRLIVFFAAPILMVCGSVIANITFTVVFLFFLQKHCMNEKEA